MADLKAERTDFKPELACLRPKRADLRLERSDLEPVSVDLRPETAYWSSRCVDSKVLFRQQNTAVNLPGISMPVHM